MKIHVLIALAISTRLHESRATALDLDAASSLLLDVLHVSSSMTNDLSTKVKARNRFKVNGNLLLRPFTLFSVNHFELEFVNETYSSKLVSLDLLWLSSTEASFIHEVG
jgi:hypothetical protein